MEDFSILHLSDLHAHRTDGKLTKTFKNLICDIRLQAAYCDNIIIVVTGDLVHQGNYKCKNSVIAFFSEVKKCIGNKVRGLYIVPGNHDKRRDTTEEEKQNDSDRKIIRRYHTPTVKSKSKFYENNWNHFRDKFENYSELVSEIYHLFGFENIEDETFGVNIQQINGHNIAFMWFNTAWSCLGEKDERNLVLGDFQLNFIWEKYNKMLGEGIDLTIAMGHHPLDWLTGREETFVQEQIMSRNRLNVDVYLSGHIHDRSVVNLQTPGHSLTTLVSGIGWPDDGKTDKQNTNSYHNYAWYTFNLDLNSIDVYVRKTDSNGKFTADIMFYPDNRSKHNEKMIMPLNANRVLTYLDLATVNGRSSKAYYISEEALQAMQVYINIMRAIQKVVSIEFEKLRIDIYQQLIIQVHESESLDAVQRQEVEKMLIQIFLVGDAQEIYNELRNIYVKNNSEMMETAFQVYLYDICTVFCEKINAALKEIDGKEHVMRAHFRWLNKDTNQYEQLCTNRTSAIDLNPMKPLEWGELLRESYICRHPLIASINKFCCKESFERNEKRSDKQNKWMDFLTAIPDFTGNEYVRPVRYFNNKSLQPWITFGITAYDDADCKILYMMDYFNVSKIVAEFIDEFLYFIPINIEHFVTANIDTRKDHWTEK